MKTPIILVIAMALLVGSSAFAQNSTGHDYSRTRSYYQEPAKHEVSEKRMQRREKSSQTVRYETGHDYSRTGPYREPKVVRRDDDRSLNRLRHEQPMVVAPASAPNRFGTTNP